MTKEQCIEMLPIMIAFAGGETVEIYDSIAKLWRQVDNIGFGSSPDNYRVLTTHGEYIYFNKKN